MLDRFDICGKTNNCPGEPAGNFGKQEPKYEPAGTALTDEPDKARANGAIENITQGA